jgi:hypothetical protein
VTKAVGEGFLFSQPNRSTKREIVMIAQIQTQPQPQQPQFPVLSPYAWQDIGIIGFVVVSFAIALGKWLPSYLDKRWALRQKEIELTIALQEQSMKAELLRDASDQKLLADSYSTMLAKQLQGSHELLENLAVTQLNISRMVEAFETQQQSIALGFEQSTQNQARTIALLEGILEALSKRD